MFCNVAKKLKFNILYCMVLLLTADTADLLVNSVYRYLQLDKSDTNVNFETYPKLLYRLRIMLYRLNAIQEPT